MRLVVLALAALVAVSIMVCGGDARPPGSIEDVTQDDYRFLAEGEFIDSKPIGGSSAWISVRGGLPGVVSRADATVLVEILEVVDVTIPTRPAPPNWPVDELEDMPVTTYSARVDQWVKGSGQDKILITGFGGVTAAGPRFSDADFLLEPARRYVLALYEKREALPGPGQYERGGLGFGAFEVTDGYVHVLNNPLTQELQEQFGGMSVAQFVDILRDYVANPPPSPTPPPKPPDIGAVGEGSLVIDSVAIDTDVDNARANTATSLGGRQGCNTLTTGETVTIDITVDAVAPLGEAEGGGITGFQFKLLYDPKVVMVAALDPNLLLAANPGSSLIPLGDGTPDTDGSFTLAVADLGRSNPESGSGVLARIVLEAVRPGVSPLTLTHVGITDDSLEMYTIHQVLNAQVAVDVPCPGTP